MPASDRSPRMPQAPVVRVRMPHAPVGRARMLQPPVRRARMLRARALIATLLLIPLLAACAGIPNSGAVVPGSEVSEQDTGGFEYIVEGPEPGATQEEILRGFIAAFKSSGDYDVARQFLTAELSGEWDPRESVLIHAGRVTFTSTGDTSMDYTVSARASVDATGRYSDFAPTATTMSYRFVEEDGEWRISEAPTGIVLSAGSFDQVFEDHLLYFVDASGRALVPDLRWFPSTNAPTRIVSALLAGPPSWLQGAVTSAFPPATQLTSPKRVSVVDGRAEVDLTVEALSASTTQRQTMRMQLEASLGRVASVTSTRLTVQGAELTIGDAQQNAPQLRPQVDNRPLVYAEGEFGYYANGQISPIAGISERVAATEPVAAASAAGASVVAVLGSGGVSVVRRGAEPLLVDTRPGLVTPTLDDHGWVWSVPAAAPNALQVFGTDGSVHDVASTLPADAQVAALEVSRDGARLAVSLATTAGPRLLVMAIIRDANAGNVPISLGEPTVDDSSDDGTPVDLAWIDETTIATVSTVDGQSAVSLHRVGGPRASFGVANGVVQIVGGNTREGVRMRSADGNIIARRPSMWQVTSTVVGFIATQR